MNFPEEKICFLFWFESTWRYKTPLSAAPLYKHQ